MEENKSLLKSARVISGATLASRILGFFRDVIIARFFGTAAGAQAFVVAFRIPNLLRQIVGEGSTNAAVVPVLARINAKGKQEEFWQAANCLLNISIVLLAGLVLAGELLAPYIVRAIAPGFIREPTKLYLAIRLTRWIFPYLLLIGLAAYAMAVLNSLKHFALPALGPCMLNISIIASCLFFCPRLKEPVNALIIGVLLGGVLQLGIQIPLLFKKGLFKNRFSGFIHPRVKEIGRLFLPRTIGIAVYQINIFVDTILASFGWIVGQGAVAALYYANRIVQLPLALFGIALAQAALPTMSEQALGKDFSQLKKTVSFSLRSIFTMMVPATIGITALSRPLIKTIFERGSFDSYSTAITSFALLFYCLSLTGYAGIKILAGCFYALRDTLSPVKIAGFALAINIVLNLILMWPLKVGGLALATAISVTANFVLLLLALRKRIGRFDKFLPTLGKVSLAGLIMGVFIWFIFYRLRVNLIVTIPAAIGVYFAALKAFAGEEAELFSGWILRKK